MAIMYNSRRANVNGQLYKAAEPMEIVEEIYMQSELPEECRRFDYDDDDNCDIGNSNAAAQVANSIKLKKIEPLKLNITAYSKYNTLAELVVDKGSQEKIRSKGNISSAEHLMSQQQNVDDEAMDVITKEEYIISTSNTNFSTKFQDSKDDSDDDCFIITPESYAKTEENKDVLKLYPHLSEHEEFIAISNENCNENKTIFEQEPIYLSDTENDCFMVTEVAEKKFEETHPKYTISDVSVNTDDCIVSADDVAKGNKRATFDAESFTKFCSEAVKKGKATAMKPAAFTILSTTIKATSRANKANPKAIESISTATESTDSIPKVALKKSSYAAIEQTISHSLDDISSGCVIMDLNQKILAPQTFNLKHDLESTSKKMLNNSVSTILSKSEFDCIDAAEFDCLVAIEDVKYDISEEQNCKASNLSDSEFDSLIAIEDDNCEQQAMAYNSVITTNSAVYTPTAEYKFDCFEASELDCLMRIENDKYEVKTEKTDIEVNATPTVNTGIASQLSPECKVLKQAESKTIVPTSIFVAASIKSNATANKFTASVPSVKQNTNAVTQQAISNSPKDLTALGNEIKPIISTGTVKSFTTTNYPLKISETLNLKTDLKINSKKVLQNSANKEYDATSGTTINCSSKIDYASLIDKFYNFYTCKICLNYFITLEKAERHIRLKHYAERHIRLKHYAENYICEKCGLKFMCPKAIQAHIYKKHMTYSNVGGTTIRFDTSTSTLYTARQNPTAVQACSVSKEYDNTTFGTTVKCCLKSDYASLVDHFYNFYTCKICLNYFITLSEAESHIQQRHYGQNYKCSECGFQYSCPKAIQTHMSKEHMKDSNVADTTIRFGTKDSNQSIPSKMQIIFVSIEQSKPNSKSTDKNKPIATNKFPDGNLESKNTIKETHSKYKCRDCDRKFVCPKDINVHISQQHCHGHLKSTVPKINVIKKPEYKRKETVAVPSPTKEPTKTLNQKPNVKLTDKNKSMVTNESSSNSTGINVKSKNSAQQIRSTFICSDCGLKFLSLKDIKIHISQQHMKGSRNGHLVFDALKINVRKKSETKHNETIAVPPPTKQPTKKLNQKPNPISTNKKKPIVTNKSSPNSPGGNVKSINPVQQIHSKYICSDCDLKFIYIKDFQTHISQQHIQKTFRHEPLVFDVPKIGVPKKPETKLNETVKVSPPTYQPTKTLDQSRFSAHTKKLNEQTYQCILCTDFENTTLDRIRNHIKIVHFGYRYICIECNLNFTNLKAVGEHLKVKHNQRKDVRIRFTTPETAAAYAQTFKEDKQLRQSTEIIDID